MSVRKTGAGILSETGKYLSEKHPPCRVALVTDYTVGALYAGAVSDSLRASGFRVFLFAFEAGESSKNLETYGKILEFFADSEITRSDLALALGGGVVGDLTGFAAATYMRGIDYVQVPTSLTAMADSSIGGKTGTDLESGKNLCGAYHFPVLTVCSTDALDTLPALYFSDGLAEIIKYAVLGNSRLLTMLESAAESKKPVRESLTPFLPEVVSECVRTKEHFFENDLRDDGSRRFLNFGHTIGHAIEHSSRYTIPHGHAVSVGMCAIARAGEKLGYTKPGTAEKLTGLVEACGLPATTYLSPDDLFNSALSDKKRQGDTISLVFPKTIGHCDIIPVPVSKLREVITLGAK